MSLSEGATLVNLWVGGGVVFQLLGTLRDSGRRVPKMEQISLRELC